MSRPSAFDAPRALARALAEVARRAGADRSREMLVRAALPTALGSWLAARVVDVRVDGDLCHLVLSDAASAAEVRRLGGEIARGLGRRVPPAAAWRVHAEVASGAERPPPRPAAPKEAPAQARPLVAAALAEVEDPGLRARLARWARVRLD